MKAIFGGGRKNCPSNSHFLSEGPSLQGTAVNEWPMWVSRYFDVSWVTKSPQELPAGAYGAWACLLPGPVAALLGLRGLQKAPTQVRSVTALWLTRHSPYCTFLPCQLHHTRALREGVVLVGFVTPLRVAHYTKPLFNPSEMLAYAF